MIGKKFVTKAYLVSNKLSDESQALNVIVPDQKELTVVNQHTSSNRPGDYIVELEVDGHIIKLSLNLDLLNGKLFYETK